jgi:peptide chain release factor 1
MLLEKLQKIENKYAELEKSIGSPETINNRELFTRTSKELSELRPLTEKFREYKILLREIEDAQSMLEEEGMKELAEVELDELEKQKETLTRELEGLLVPKDPFDEKNVIMEIRAGTGGDEAALFAGELLRMYLRYAERKFHRPGRL